MLCLLCALRCVALRVRYVCCECGVLCAVYVAVVVRVVLRCAGWVCCVMFAVCCVLCVVCVVCCVVCRVLWMLCELCVGCGEYFGL